MAKKKGGDQTSKKAEQKKKAQKLEDMTFGLKNKSKSKKVGAIMMKRWVQLKWHSG